MKYNKFKVIIAAVALALSVLISGDLVSAATVDNGKSMGEVGDVEYIENAVNLKINGKKFSKLKKKIKTVKTSTNSQYSTYRTKSYFLTSSAYSNSNAYEADNGSQAKKYFPANADYKLTFRKAGKYKITYDTYSLESYDTTYEYSDGKYVYWITKYNRSTGNYDKVTQYEYVSSGDAAVEGYYKGTNGKIYADGDQGIVPASVVTAADGQKHVKYTAKKLEKVTHVYNYNIRATTRIIKSVKLGKVTQKGSNTYTEAGYKASSVYGKFLSGNSGKLSITLADKKNYSITGVLVGTYDDKSNLVCVKSGSGKKVTFGSNKYKSESSETTDPQYKYYNTDMYNPTYVYILYKNKYTGVGTTLNNVTTDAEGNTVYTFTRTYNSKNPSTGKYQTLSDKYTITRTKNSSDKYRYSYVENYKYWDYEKNAYVDTTSESSGYSDLMDIIGGSYATYVFYKK